jgi:hypothetical protein
VTCSRECWRSEANHVTRRHLTRTVFFRGAPVVCQPRCMILFLLADFGRRKLHDLFHDYRLLVDRKGTPYVLLPSHMSCLVDDVLQRLLTARELRYTISYRSMEVHNFQPRHARAQPWILFCIPTGLTTTTRTDLFARVGLWLFRCRAKAVSSRQTSASFAHGMLRTHPP